MLSSLSGWGLNFSMVWQLSRRVFVAWALSGKAEPLKSWLKRSSQYSRPCMTKNKQLQLHLLSRTWHRSYLVNNSCDLAFPTHLIEDLPRSQTLPFTEGQLKQAEADHICFTVWEWEELRETWEQIKSKQKQLSGAKDLLTASLTGPEQTEQPRGSSSSWGRSLALGRWRRARAPCHLLTGSDIYKQTGGKTIRKHEKHFKNTWASYSFSPILWNKIKQHVILPLNHFLYLCDVVWLKFYAPQYLS